LLRGAVIGRVRATRCSQANHFGYQESCQANESKMLCFRSLSPITPPVSRRMRALAIVANARWDAMDADGALDVRADGGKRAVLRGEHELSRKPLRRESTDLKSPDKSAANCRCVYICVAIRGSFNLPPQNSRCTNPPKRNLMFSLRVFLE
jgi:hypothetical protein